MFTIALDRSRKLSLPEIGIRIRLGGKAAFLVPMPKAAMDKNRALDSGQDDIRLARKVGCVGAKTATCSPEQRSNGLFRRRILAANARHVVAALLGGVNVDHSIASSRPQMGVDLSWVALFRATAQPHSMARDQTAAHQPLQPANNPRSL